MINQETFLVKRITTGCCGLVKDKIYTAKWENDDQTLGCIVIELSNTWTEPHLFTGHFELIK